MDAADTSLHNAAMRTGLISTIACCGLYLLFAGTVSVSEVATGSVLAVACGAGAVLLTRVSDHHFAFSPTHVSAVGRALGSMPNATFRTGAALLALLCSSRQPCRADTKPFHPGKDAEPHDRARRVTAILAGSLTPSTFVVNVPLQRGEVLLHGIDRKPPTVDPEWLV